MIRQPLLLLNEQQQQLRPTLLRSRGPEAAQQQKHASAGAPSVETDSKWQHQQHLQQHHLLQQLQQQQHLQQHHLLQQLQQQQQRGNQRHSPAPPQPQQQQQRAAAAVFPAATRTQAAATAEAAAGFSSLDQQILREAFAVFDRNADGLLQPAEFRAACTALGVDTPEPMAAKMLALEKKDQGISFADFCSFAGDAFSLKETADGAEELFSLFDEDNKGYITLSDLRQAAACCGAGEVFSDEQLQLMLRHLSPDSSGKVYLQQFKKLFTNKKSLQRRK